MRRTRRRRRRPTNSFIILTKLCEKQRKQNRDSERQHLRDKVEGVGEEKRNEIATESMRSRDRDIEDTGLRDRPNQ